jgi:hypothetical protein
VILRWDEEGRTQGRTDEERAKKGKRRSSDWDGGRSCDVESGALACDATWIDVEVSTAIVAREDKRWTIGCGTGARYQPWDEPGLHMRAVPKVDVTESTVCDRIILTPSPNRKSKMFAGNDPGAKV